MPTSPPPIPKLKRPFSTLVSKTATSGVANGPNKTTCLSDRHAAGRLVSSLSSLDRCAIAQSAHKRSRFAAVQATPKRHTANILVPGSADSGSTSSLRSAATPKQTNIRERRPTTTSFNNSTVATTPSTPRAISYNKIGTHVGLNNPVLNRSANATLVNIRRPQTARPGTVPTTLAQLTKLDSRVRAATRHTSQNVKSSSIIVPTSSSLATRRNRAPIPRQLQPKLIVPGAPVVTHQSATPGASTSRGAATQRPLASQVVRAAIPVGSAGLSANRKAAAVAINRRQEKIIWPSNVDQRITSQYTRTLHTQNGRGFPSHPLATNGRVIRTSNVAAYGGGGFHPGGPMRCPVGMNSGIRHPNSRLIARRRQMMADPYGLNEMTEEDRDFIDDGPGESGDGDENADWRSELRQVTGYDPARFMKMDGEAMESDLYKLETEERLSEIVARQEDLEEYRKLREMGSDSDDEDDDDDDDGEEDA